MGLWISFCALFVVFVMCSAQQDCTHVFSKVSTKFDHFIGLTQINGIRCWGNNDRLQLGLLSQSSPNPLDVPVPVTPDTLIAAGSSFTVIFYPNGSGYVWGKGGYNFTMSATYTTNDTLPTFFSVNSYLQQNETIIQVETGLQYVLLLSSLGNLFVYGQNIYGELGFVSQSEMVNFQHVVLPGHLLAVSTHSVHTLFLFSNGTVGGSGAYSLGQLGPIASSYFHEISTPAPLVQISAGFSHSIGLTSDGNVIGWGDNYFGQIGMNGQFGTIILNENVTMISAGYYHSVAYSNFSGKFFAWGSNANNQIDGSMIQNYPNYQFFVIPPADRPLIQIFAGTSTSGYITSRGVIVTFGGSTPSPFIPINPDCPQISVPIVITPTPTPNTTDCTQKKNYQCYSPPCTCDFVTFEISSDEIVIGSGFYFLLESTITITSSTIILNINPENFRGKPIFTSTCVQLVNSTISLNILVPISGIYQVDIFNETNNNCSQISTGNSLLVNAPSCTSHDISFSGVGATFELTCSGGNSIINAGIIAGPIVSGVVLVLILITLCTPKIRRKVLPYRDRAHGLEH